MKKRLLIVQCRGLGDAIISTGLINSLRNASEDLVIDVWASEEVAPIFKQHPSVARCYVQRFPVLRRQRWSFAAPIRVIGQVRELRANRYDIALNVVGDIRENFLTALVGAERTWSVVWEEGHPIKQLVHPGLSRFIDYNSTVPKSCTNIYSVYRMVGVELERWVGMDLGEKHAQSDVGGLTSGGRSARIGIHPLANQHCREWPFEKWVTLIDRMLELGYEVMVFGAPSERQALEEAFEAKLVDPRVSLVTADLEAFVKALGGLAIFVGLDSFGIHAAYAEGVPAIMINGANDPSVWAPPGATVVGNGGDCPHYPCFNRPRCEGTTWEYVCVRSVSVSEVCVALDGKISERRVGREIS